MDSDECYRPDELVIETTPRLMRWYVARKLSSQIRRLLAAHQISIGDVIQDATVELLTKKFERKYSPTTLACHTVRYCALDRIEKCRWRIRLNQMLPVPKPVAPDMGFPIDIAAALAMLNDQELHVIKARYGFGCVPRGQMEIGVDLGVSRARISQIEASALAKLLDILRDKK